MIQIYIYENLINGKVYIGQTADIEKRAGKNGSGYKKSSRFYNAINKYGWNNFSVNIITSSDSQEITDEDETYWIARARELLGKENIYNIADGGDGSPMRGKQHTEEANEKNRQAHLGGTPWNKGIPSNTSPWNKGKTGLKIGTPKGTIFSEEHKLNLSEAHKGYKHTEETREKLSEATKGKNNPFFGKTHSEEAKRKVSVANKGRQYLSDEKIQQMKNLLADGMSYNQIANIIGCSWHSVAKWIAA